MTATMEATWQKNVAEHPDERLTGPRGSWWYTGRQPEPGRCAGVGLDGRLTSLPLPDLSTCDRQAVLDYFDNSWALTEVLFAGLQTTEAFYRPPDHNLRHPLIFYYGHPAALYVNKLRVSGLLDGPVNAYFEEILETGVDEMSWDDLSKNDMVWPAVSEVHAYRAEVYGLIRKLIRDTQFAPDQGRPVTMDDRAWALFLAFEHDRIHLETSSVLIREMPVRLVRPPAAWPEPAPMRRTTDTGQPNPEAYPANEVVSIPGGHVKFGKPRSFPSYGWDNEYGSREAEVVDFEAARYLVSNGEFYRFVIEGGYRREELWSEEGWGWRRFRNAKWPRFWVQDGPAGLHRYRLRTIFEDLDMPWDWPVCVNYHEAKAYCAWRSEQDGRDYRLPTEAEFRRMRALPDEPSVADDPVMSSSGQGFRRSGVNLNLAWGSESPVDHSPPTEHGVHDTAGNVWQWCENTFHPLQGFAVHPYYDDFSTPCFDGEHQMILGGAFVSTGDEASIWARFHFRPHFLQQSGIRLVASTDAADTQTRPDQYATREMLDRYLLMHYGRADEMFDRPSPLQPAHGYPQRLATLLLGAAGGDVRRVMDLGCAVGGASFALAGGPVREVVGVDRSVLFVETARALARGEGVDYDRPDQGDVTTGRVARRPDTNGAEVEFTIADAGDLPGTLGRFDAVLMANLLDRLSDPVACLRQFTDSDQFLASGGLLLVASPWSWLPEHTPTDDWLGGQPSGPTSEEQIRRLLARSFDLIAESDEPGVLRDHSRHFEYFEADVTVWRKK